MFKAILVDDEAIVLEGMQRRIDWTSLDVEVIGCANDGVEGLELIRQTKPDIIITDVNMPVMDGITMLKHIHSMNIQCETLILSGHSNFEYAQQAMQYGAASYLLKPCTEDDISCAVRDVASRIRQNQEAKLLIDDMMNLQEDKNSLIRSGLFLTMLQNKNIITEEVVDLLTDLLPGIRDSAFRIGLIDLNHNLNDAASDRLAKSFNSVLTREYDGFAVQCAPNRLSFIVVDDNIDEKGFYTRMLDLIAIETEIDRERFQIFLSSLSNTLHDIPALYDQANTCVENRYLFSDAVLRYEMLEDQSLINTEQGSTSSKILHYVNEHFNENISLQDLSEKLYLTPNYITTLFKKDTGTTFKRYLTKVRLDHAKKLLKDTNTKISDIAALVGYDNDEYFCKVFKKTTGSTPSDYRKANI